MNNFKIEIDKCANTMNSFIHNYQMNHTIKEDQLI